MKKEIIILCSITLIACAEENVQSTVAMGEAEKLWKEQTEILLQTKEVGSLMQEPAVQNISQMGTQSRE